MLWIGLTGGIATGKSTVAKLFIKNGVPVIDADLIAHQVVGPGTPGLMAVVREFGLSILKPDQSLDRTKLGSVVFSHPERLRALEKIIHPEVQDEVQRQRARAEKNGSWLCVYDVPLLFERDLQDQFDGVIVVSCLPELQERRLKSRSHLSQQEAMNRIQSQMGLTEKMQRADWVIENNEGLDALERKFNIIFQQLKEKASQQ